VSDCIRFVLRCQTPKIRLDHRLRATTSATINGSSILTTTDRVWDGPFIIVGPYCRPTVPIVKFIAFSSLTLIRDDVLQLVKLYFFAKITQISVIFCVSKFQKKWAILRFPLNVQKQKMFQLQGASPLDPPTRASAPGPRWGLRPQTPVIGSCPTRSPCPLPFAKS